MLSGVCIGTNDIAHSTAFYDAVLKTLGMMRVLTEEYERGYAGWDGKITVFVISPYNGQAATFGNGTQFMFHSADKEGVDAFHATAVSHGGTDEGAPGPRDYHPNYYGAYVRDPDGNKLNVSISLDR